MPSLRPNTPLKEKATTMGRSSSGISPTRCSTSARRARFLAMSAAAFSSCPIRRPTVSMRVKMSSRLFGVRETKTGIPKSRRLSANSFDTPSVTRTRSGSSAKIRSGLLSSSLTGTSCAASVIEHSPGSAAYDVSAAICSGGAMASRISSVLSPNETMRRGFSLRTISVPSSSVPR